MNEIVEKMPFLRTECRNNAFIRQVMYRIQKEWDPYILIDDLLKLYVELQEALFNVYKNSPNKTMDQIFNNWIEWLKNKNII